MKFSGIHLKSTDFSDSAPKAENTYYAPRSGGVRGPEVACRGPFSLKSFKLLNFANFSKFQEFTKIHLNYENAGFHRFRPPEPSIFLGFNWYSRNRAKSALFM